MRIVSEVEVPELRRLLHAIKDSGYDVGIRFRKAGELWANSFCKIVSINDMGIAIFDEQNNRLYFIRNLSAIMQFELDNNFQNFQPNYHYSVISEASATAVD